MKKRAFTLVEMCIVLAIVMILAALLLGVIGRLREKSRQTTCQSNLHQLYLGLTQYVSDNDSQFPNFPQKKEKLMPYLKSAQVYICPSVSRPFPPDFAAQDNGQDYDFALGWFHTLNFVPSPSGGLPVPQLTGVNEAAIIDTASIPVLSDVAYQAFQDANREVPFPRGASCGLTWADGTPQVSSGWPTLHHEGLNVLFYDGHVKWMSPEGASAMMCDAGQYAQPPFRAGGSHLARGR